MPQGCFWGVEQKFAQKFKGAVQTTVGYTGGTTQKPTYGQVQLSFICLRLSLRYELKGLAYIYV